MNETWRPIPGWEGRYSVSDLGRVRSEDRSEIRIDGQRLTLLGRLLKPNVKRRTGHLWVALMSNSVRTHQSVHRLVLEAFVGPCPDGMIACHWDDNPLNNHLSNLRWGTLSENCRDKVRNGRHHNTQKTHCPQGHPYDSENTAVGRRRNGDTYRMCRICRRAGDMASWYRRRDIKANAAEAGTS